MPIIHTIFNKYIYLCDDSLLKAGVSLNVVSYTVDPITSH